MDQALLDKGSRAAIRMAADRGLKPDRAALLRALLAVAGQGDSQEEPNEVAEDALELLGLGLGAASSRRTRRPF